MLRENPQVREKVVAIFAEAEPFVPSDNVDAQLYNGFFSDADRAAMNIVLQTEPRNLPALDITFADARIEKLMFNYRARNYLARWMKPNRRAGFSIVVMCLHRSFCRATRRSWRCCIASMKEMLKSRRC